MRTPSCRTLLAIACFGVAVESLPAQAVIAAAPRTDSLRTRPRAEAPDTITAPPQAVTPPPRLFGMNVSGYVESGFHVSNHAAGGAIAGRLYERSSNQFALNAIALTLDRPIAPDRLSAGVRADVVVGQNAAMLKSSGFNLGPHADVYQLYTTVNIPTDNGEGVQVRVGRMATFMGVEVIETPLNPNLSIGNEFIFVENFTQTGVSIEHRFNRVVDAQFRVLNGWDQVQDLNDRLSYMLRVGLAPDAQTMIAVEGFVGPEQPHDNAALRTGAELIVRRTMGRVTTWLQGDVGREQRNAALPDSSRDATWWAASSWVVVDATPSLGVALRADYLHDRHAARTASAFGLVGAPGHRLASATATLNMRHIPGILFRPEVRYDRSNQPVFASHRQQITFGMSAAYVF
jgi:hypothetical protein